MKLFRSGWVFRNHLLDKPDLGNELFSHPNLKNSSINCSIQWLSWPIDYELKLSLDTEECETIVSIKATVKEI